MHRVMRSGRELVAIAVLAWAGGGPVAAQSELVVTAAYGFHGALPARDPCPVTVRLENATPDPIRLDLELLSSSAFTTEVLLRRNLEISPGVARVTTLLASGGAGTSPVLRIVADRRLRMTLQSRGRVPKTIDGESVGHIALEPENARDLTRGVLALGGRARQVMTALVGAPEGEGVIDRKALYLDGTRNGLCLLDAADAPDTSLAYDAFRTILWTAPDPTDMPNPAQWAALLQWVHRGGRLVILAAHRPESLAHDALAPFLNGARFEARPAPYPAPDLADLRDMRANAFLLSAVAPTDFEAVKSTPGWFGQGPLRSMRRAGMGLVVVAGFDPFVYDLGRPALFLQMLTSATGVEGDLREEEASAHAALNMPSGLESLAAVLENGNILRPPLWLYLLLGFAFVVVIGPLDYVMLKRRKKLHWSPVTLLLYTAIFSSVCIGATFLIFAPDAETNRIALLDLYVGADGDERVHGNLYHGIYAPVGGSFRPGPSALESFGAAAERAGPMTRLGATAMLSDRLPWSRQVWLGNGRQLADLSLRFNTFRGVATRVSGPAQGTVAVVLEETAPGKRELRVRNFLDAPLEHGVFTWKDNVVRLPPVPPGESLRFPLPAEPRSLHQARLCSHRMATLPPGVGWFHQIAGSAPVTPVGATGIDEAFASWLHSMAIDDRWCEVPEEFLQFARRGRFDQVPRREPGSWSLGWVRERDLGLFLAVTTGLPFDDPAGSENPGYTIVQVRRVVDLP